MKPPLLNIIEALSTGGDYHTAIFFTYGVDLAFYESMVLETLREKGCRNQLLFVDSMRYADTIASVASSGYWAGRRYVILPIFAPRLCRNPACVLSVWSARVQPVTVRAAAVEVTSAYSKIIQRV